MSLRSWNFFYLSRIIDRFRLYKLWRVLVVSLHITGYQVDCINQSTQVKKIEYCVSEYLLSELFQNHFLSSDWAQIQRQKLYVLLTFDDSTRIIILSCCQIIYSISRLASNNTVIYYENLLLFKSYYCSICGGILTVQIRSTFVKCNFLFFFVKTPLCVL